MTAGGAVTFPSFASAFAQKCSHYADGTVVRHLLDGNDAHVEGTRTLSHEPPGAPP